MDEGKSACSLQDRMVVAASPATCTRRPVPPLPIPITYQHPPIHPHPFRPVPRPFITYHTNNPPSTHPPPFSDLCRVRLTLRVINRLDVPIANMAVRVGLPGAIAAANLGLGPSAVWALPLLGARDEAATELHLEVRDVGGLMGVCCIVCDGLVGGACRGSEDIDFRTATLGVGSALLYHGQFSHSNSAYRTPHASFKSHIPHLPIPSPIPPRSAPRAASGPPFTSTGTPRKPRLATRGSPAPTAAGWGRAGGGGRGWWRGLQRWRRGERAARSS